MPVYRKVSGSWETTVQYRKVSGSWQRSKWYYKHDGTWIPVSGLIIDDFEDGDDSEWSIPGTGNRSIVGGLNGTNFAWEHNGFTEAHLAGANAVDRGPQPGDIWEFWFEITNDNGNSVINRFEFAADGTADDDKYRIEWERNTGDTELSLEKFSNGSQELLDTDENFVPNLDQVYRMQVEWNAGNNNINVQAFFPNGNTASSVVSISDNSSGEFAQPGIAIITNDNNTSTYDEIRVIES